MRRLLILLFVCGLLGYASAEAATINAASCSPTDVQAAHTAASSGDTIQLPTCTFTTWNTTVTITKTNLTLKGNGQANTILRRSNVTAWWDVNPMFRCNGAPGFVAQDFTLNGTQDTGAGTWEDVGIRLDSCIDFRVHHVTLEWLRIGMVVAGDPAVMRGVIDHNTFLDIHGNPDGAQDSWGYGVLVHGNGGYPALSLGTSQNVFIEDNTFTRPKSAVASANGSRYVFRYNTITETSINAIAVETHGYTGVWAHGSRQYEIYNNTIDIPSNLYRGISPCGGDGVIFDNVIDPLYSDEIVLCNSQCSGGYPQQDQIRDLYLWGNTLVGGGAAGITNICTSLIQLNRDYFLTTKGGYAPYTYPHPLTLSADPCP